VSAGGRLQPGRTGFEGAEASDRLGTPLRAPMPADELAEVYAALLDAYGEQQWWPTAAEDEAERRLEICLGAILTQNTAWRGAAAALGNLRVANALSCEAILDLPEDALGDLIRPSGYYNTKARKLKAFAETLLFDHGGSIDALLAGDVDEVRQRLLAIWGIGPETADAMALYAARLPTFVVDAYAYRLFERLGRPPGPRRYEVYRDFFLERLEPDPWVLNEWHALIVRHGQRTCTRSRPRCDKCLLLDRCDFGQGEVTGR
jgi:endonuclease III related protein